MKRREFLKTVGAVGAVASIPQSSHPQKIDIHNHYYPESYFQMVRDLAGDDYAFDTDTTGTTIIKFRGARFFGIQPPMTDVSLRLEAMDRVGIDVQVLSVSVPNVYFAGWTVRQVVHHLPDSHLNSYVRFKLAVTEDEPTIKAFDEAAWARLDDAQNAPIEGSLELLESLHERWIRFLRALGPKELARTFKHPELGSVSVAQNIALYAWHGRHHVAHITSLREREGWT